MWNYTFSPRRYDNLITASKPTHIDSNGSVVREDEAFFMKIQTVGPLVVDPKPVDNKYKEELHRNLLSVSKPFDSYGLAVASTVYYDRSEEHTSELQSRLHLV